MMFKDRSEAGRMLSFHLMHYKQRKNAVVLGLARGGAVVAYEVAKALLLPFNVVVPRKIGVPGYPELALGAMAENGEILLNDEIVHLSGASPALIKREIEKEKKVQQERLFLYRQAAPLGSLEGKTVLLVDDGIATGATFFVQLQSLKKQTAEKIVVACPVSSLEAWSKIKAAADEAICLCLEEAFLGIGSFYQEFDQVEDKTILALLRSEMQA
jgi:Predicted phosphoribosyltransferases